MMNSLETHGRYQGVLCSALVHMDRLYLSGPLDEYFWEEFRDGLLAAGATELEIREFAVSMIVWIVENTEPRSDDRREQIELISEHLVKAGLTVRIGEADSFVEVTFHRAPAMVH